VNRRQYLVEASLTARLIVAGFFLFGTYETALAHDWAVTVLFAIPGALAAVAAVRLALLKIGVILWH
jgi:hypothetical protein